MAWNGSGGFTLLYSWVARRDAGSPTNLIGATEMDAEFANIKTGLENCVTRDGQNAATAALPMGGYAHTGVGAATARTQYARVTEAQDGTLWKAASPGGTIDAMTGTLAPAITAYAANMIVTIVAPGTGSNTVTNPTINLNSIGVKTIKKHQGALVAGDYAAGDILVLVYDGTYFELLNPKYPSANNPHSGFTTDTTGGAMDDLLPFIDTSDSSADNKVAVSDFFKNVYANATADTTGGATGDVLLFGDASESGAVNSMTVTNLFTNVLANFTAKSAPILADTVMVADSAASGAPKISTWQQVFNALSLTTAKTSLASGDKLYMGDSAASDVAKYVTWSNLKTQLLTDLTASQTNVEGATVSNVFVTPQRMQHHPGVAKFWAYVTVSAGTPSINVSHNVTSVTDAGTGQLTVTIDTDFSTTWCCMATVEELASNSSGTIISVEESSIAVGSVTLNAMQTGASSNATNQDPKAYNVAGFGDQ